MRFPASYGARASSPASTIAASRRASTLSATPSAERNCSKRVVPVSASRSTSSTHGSPTTSSERAIGQAASDQSERSGTGVSFSTVDGGIWLA